MNSSNLIDISCSNVDFNLSKELKNIPHLSERMLIDLVNGLEVTEDLIRFEENQGLVSKVAGFFDGSYRRREGMIQQNNQKSISSLTSWVLELTKVGTYTNESITYIGNRLYQTREALQKVMRISADNHFALEEHENRLKQMESYINSTKEELESRIEKVENENDARYRIEEVIEAWKADYIYNDYPPFIQVFFAIQDLIRGREGKILFSSDRYKTHIINVIINTLQFKHNIGKNDYVSLKQILTNYCCMDPGIKTDIFLYLTDHQDRGYLLTSLSEYVRDNNIPAWLEEHQKQGKLSSFYQTNEFLYEMTQELCGVRAV